MVGFCAVLPQPTGTANFCKRIHRLVILPDYQGLGVGTKFLDAMCKHYVDSGYKTYIRSAHIKLAAYWKKHLTWRPTARNGKKGELNGVNKNPNSVSRECYSYEYVGEDYATKPHKEVVIDGLDGLDKNEMYKNLVNWKKSNYLTIVHGEVKKDDWLNKMCRDLGIRTELLRIFGKVSKKHFGKLLYK